MINFISNKNIYQKPTVTRKFMSQNKPNFYLEQDTFLKTNISFKAKYGEETLANAFKKASEKGAEFREDEIRIIKEIYKTNPKKAVGIIRKFADEIPFYLKEYSGFKTDSAQSKFVRGDIELIRKSIIEQVNVEDLMVPMFETTESATEEVEVGDVFEVDGILYIKTNYEAKQLNINKKTYCALFPPVERYASGQGKTGDCYLVAALNSIMANPKTRVNLLTCFSEDKDGNVVVRMPDTNVEETLKEDESIKNLGVKKRKHIKGALGMQLLEYVYKKTLVEERKEKNSSEIKQIKESIVKLKQSEEFLQSLGISIYEENLETRINERLKELRKQLKEGEDLSIGREIIVKICNSVRLGEFSLYLLEGLMGPMFTKLDFKSELNEREIVSDEFLARLSEFKKECILLNSKLNMDAIKAVIKNLVNRASIDEVMKYIKVDCDCKKLEEIQTFTFGLGDLKTAQEEIEALERKNNKKAINENRAIEKIGGRGGRPSDVFAAFHLEGAYTLEFFKGKENVDDFLSTVCAGDEYALVGGVATKEGYERNMKDNGIKLEKLPKEEQEYYKKLPTKGEIKKAHLVGKHAYSLDVKWDEDKKEYYIIATNPWVISDSKRKEVVLSVDEFKKYFARAYSGYTN